MADDARLASPPAAPSAAGPLRLTAAEYDALIAAGAAARLGRVELRGGEVWRMSPQHAPHMRMKLAVYRSLSRRLEGGAWAVGLEATVAFGDFMPDPDVFLYAPGPYPRSIPGSSVPLAIEIAHTTLDDDLGDKRARYAAAGLAEYWVVDMVNGQVLRFHQPLDGRFAAAPPVPAGAPCASLTLPGVAVETADWPWDQGAAG